MDAPLSHKRELWLGNGSFAAAVSLLGLSLSSLEIPRTADATDKSCWYFSDAERRLWLACSPSDEYGGQRVGWRGKFKGFMIVSPLVSAVAHMEPEIDSSYKFTWLPRQSSVDTHVRNGRLLPAIEWVRRKSMMVRLLRASSVESRGPDLQIRLEFASSPPTLPP